MKNDRDVRIRYVEKTDREFWFSLDRHLSAAEFDKKVRDKQGYVLTADGSAVGILRYNLFWDNTPFCTLLYIAEDQRYRGFGAALMRYFENEMKVLGYRSIMVSTQADEGAQHFYRKIGYKDCGGLFLSDQATELFFIKELG